MFTRMLRAPTGAGAGTDCGRRLASWNRPPPLRVIAFREAHEEADGYSAELREKVEGKKDSVIPELTPYDWGGGQTTSTDEDSDIPEGGQTTSTNDEITNSVIPELTPIVMPW